MSKSKRDAFELKTKVDIIKEVDDKVPYANILCKFNLKNKSNVSRIYKDKEKIFASGTFSTVSFPRLRKNIKRYFFLDF